jgi:hypothetical protein
MDWYKHDYHEPRYIMIVDVGEKVVVFRWKNPFLDSAQKVN